MKSIFCVLIVARMFAAGTAAAQDASRQSAPAAAPPQAASEPIQPDLGEMMALQQMRHIKLWFAGNERNWPLAEYELGEIREGFDDVSKLVGEDVVEKHVGARIDAVDKAIDGEDFSAFAAAFDQLNAGCNACHQAFAHGFIVVQRPTIMPYTDQSFSPQK